ncbi:MAG TPA: amidohydrolase family protein [Micromonosporaceae bacterium]|jgi:imidazolonepropionase-like amidohydrolase|nr:amidohydrolase family protein [Micromonosporaceae bacterium]
MALHVRGVLLPDDDVVDLWLVGDRVTRTPVPGADTISDRGFVLPGLVDAHCHIGIAPGSRPIAGLDEARALAAVDRDAGVLAIRDAGSPYPYGELDDDPDVPRLARAGQHVAPVRRYLRDIGVEVVAADVAGAVATQAKAGNGWVKLVGDWIDREVGDLSPAWDVGTLAAAVQAAHEAGVRMTAHCFAEESVAALVAAGIDCVEHGTGLTADGIAEMAARGTALVPTMINIETFEAIAASADARFPRYAQHMRRLRAAFPSIVGAAVDAGVPVYVGSDAGGGIDHGMAAAEMLMLHDKAGMSVDAVLAAGSWGAREWLGFPGLVEGGLADLVVYDADPRRDLHTLRDPKRIVLRGRVVL